MSDISWNTAITKVEPNELRLRGYKVDELMGNIGFAEGIFLALKGRLPSKEESTLFNAIFVSSIDHGPTPPSAIAARTAASTGASLNAAVATGILSINRFHGGAIFDCMGVISEGLSMLDETDSSLADVARALVEKIRTEKKRIPGLGLHHAQRHQQALDRHKAVASLFGNFGRLIHHLGGLAVQIDLRRIAAHLGLLAHSRLDSPGDTRRRPARLPG